MVEDNSQTIDRIRTWLTAKAGESNQKEPILQLTENVLKRYRNEVGNLNPPIDLNVLGKCLDIKVKKILLSKDINSDALLIPIVGGFKIELKDEEKLHNTYRTRYSCAHEMAHTFFYKMEKNGAPSRAVPSGSEYEEKLCDLAAAEFLMPEKNFKIKSEEIITKYGHSFEGLMRLREIFKTSLQSITIKAINNDWRDYLIAKWNPVYADNKSIMRFEKEWEFSKNPNITMPSQTFETEPIFGIFNWMKDYPGKNKISRYIYEKEFSIDGIYTRVMLLNDGHLENLTLLILTKISEYRKRLGDSSDFSGYLDKSLVLDFNFEEIHLEIQKRTTTKERKNLVDFM